MSIESKQVDENTFKRQVKKKTTAGICKDIIKQAEKLKANGKNGTLYFIFFKDGVHTKAKEHFGDDFKIGNFTKEANLYVFVEKKGKKTADVKEENKVKKKEEKVPEKQSAAAAAAVKKEENDDKKRKRKDETPGEEPPKKKYKQISDEDLQNFEKAFELLVDTYMLMAPLVESSYKDLYLTHIKSKENQILELIANIKTKHLQGTVEKLKKYSSKK
jgi:hypothetical protein